VANTTSTWRDHVILWDLKDDTSAIDYTEESAPPDGSEKRLLLRLQLGALPMRRHRTGREETRIKVSYSLWRLRFSGSPFRRSYINLLHAFKSSRCGCGTDATILFLWNPPGSYSIGCGARKDQKKK